MRRSYDDIKALNVDLIQMSISALNISGFWELLMAYLLRRSVVKQVKPSLLACRDNRGSRVGHFSSISEFNVVSPWT